MKTRINRYARSAFALILAICMLLSCVMQSGAAMIEGESVAGQYNANWQAKKLYFVAPDSWDLGTYGHVQVDITRTTSTSDSNYQCYIATMTRVGTSRLYQATINANHNGWNQNEYIAFTANSSDYGNGTFSLNTNHYYTTPKDYGVNNSSNYYAAIPDSDANGCTVSIDWNATRDTLMKKTQTATVRTNKASSSTGGSVSLAGYYFTSDTAIASSSSSPSYDGVYGTTMTMTATANTGYDFDGWYSDSSCTTKLSSDTTYSYTVSGAKTVYANFASKTYNISFSQPSNGSIKINNSTSSPVSVNHGSSVSIVITPSTGYKIKTLTDNGSAVSAAVGKTTAYTYTISNVTAAHTIAATMEAAHTQLSAPATVTLNGSAANCTVDTTTVGAKIRLAWSSVSNAGSYKVYKGDTLITTVTGQLYYDIERAYSYSGTYSVVAVPSNTNTYSESPKSTTRTLTVNKSRLNTPTLTVTPTAIANGDSVSLTVTDTNTSFTASEFGYYYYTGSSVTISNDYLMTPGVAKTLYPTSNTTYNACVYPKNGANNDYYLQSYSTSASQVSVYTPAYYLVGDLVDSTNNKWNTSLQDYPVDEFVSANVFKRTVTYATGGTNDKHHFRLNNGTNQYTVTNGTDTDMSTHTTSSTAVTASTATTSGSMYVTGQGTYTIYVNQATSGSPKVWVEKTEPQKYTTIVYVNKDSGATNMYVWKDANNAESPWPGEDITTTEESVNDIPYYKYTFESYWDHFDIVVNKGDDQHKSADLTNIAASNTYYVTWDGVHMSTPSISTTAPVIQLGYKIGENGTVTHADFTNRSVSVNLSANTIYDFWLKSANSHLNDQGNGTMTRANCSNWSFPVNNTNTKIQTDLAGTYTFTYTVSNGNITVSVTYPPEPKYNVTVNQGDHGTVKVNGNNFTTGGTIQVGSLTTASIEAVAASGYHFTGWTTSGGVAAVSGYTTSSNPITISASAQGTITATYAENSYTLTLAGGGNGSITTPSSKTLTVHPITATSLSGVTVTPANGYKFNGWTAGTGVTLTGGSTSSPSTGTVKATQNSTLTANFTKVSYTLTGKTSLNGTVGSYGTVTFYSDADCNNLITTAQIGNTVYAKFTSNDYALVSFTKSGTGSSGGTTTGNVYSFTMGYANTTVTAAVRELTSVTYYVDMHDNNVSSLSVAVCSQGWSSVLKDGNGNNCSHFLTRQGTSSVYAYSIKTPVTQTNGTYSDLYIRVTFNGTNYNTINIPGTKVATLVSTHEMWLEAENEESTKLTVNYATNSTSTVADGYRRIYVAKPYSWESSETNWATLGIYHWGEYTDIGWSNGIRMNYLGKSGTGADDYHYYYADIPKAINGNKVSNIIFQGWSSSNPAAGTTPNAQTGNIENIPDSANFFYLSKVDGAFVGTKSEEDAVIPNYTRYVSSVEMNKTESTEVNIKPTYTGENITYTSGSTSVVTVDSNGKITPVGRGTTTITVKIYGTIGNLVTTEDTNHWDYRTYTVSVTVKDPTQFNSFEIMSLESQNYTVDIPAISNDQPGYFESLTITVSGIKGVASSTNSAIITPNQQTNPTSYTVKYAKANNLFTGYNGIKLVGTAVTKSFTHTTSGQRYGLDHWERKYASDNTVASPNPSYSTSTSVSGSIETATTSGIVFETTYSTYSAKFAAYDYVDVTFTFNYWEYKPKKVDAEGNVVADDADGMIQYPYDATWAGGEDTSNANFAGSHTLRTVTVENYEVRNKTASNVAASDLVAPALTAIGVKPDNNYYNYNIAADNITISNRNASSYTAGAAVNMTHSVKYYSVYLNGNLVRDNYTYQEYAAPSVNTASDWYAVDDRNSTDTTNAPLLATNVDSYKFRVKGSAKSTNTYLRTATATNPHGNDFLRSEVDFSHYEVTHQGSTPTTMKEYLMQNFYIADFFSPAEVLDPNTSDGHGGHLPYDDAQFVGGGVVYYSMNGVTDNNAGTPFANAVSSGYVDGNTGEANAAAIKEMLKANIEAYHSDDVSRALGEEEAMKIAYGTEIKATKNVEGGFNTGIIYRYLPMNQYKRNGAGEQTFDIELTSSNNIVKWTPSSKVENKWQVTSVNDVNDTASNGQRTVRFVNNQGWDVVCVHYWGGSKASYWPGIKMTVVEGQNNVYEAVIPADSKYVVFSDGGYMPETDANGEYTLKKDVNSNTFRYSNTLQSYQYVYASGNENKETNAGKNMRLYSYYVYSYVAYNQETNVPETRYEIVLSDNYSDASTYWKGSNN